MKKNKVLWIAALALIFLLAGLCTAFAAEDWEYRVYDAWWQVEPDGGLTARWERPEAATSYHVQLYKGTNKKKIGNWVACSGNVKNFTWDIVTNGSGTYYFAVYPDKLGESAKVWSDRLDVDSQMITNARKALNNSPSEPVIRKHTVKLDSILDGLGLGAFNETGAPRWVQLPDGKWVYQKADSSLYKNTWVQVNGKWYLFDKTGYMLANGWQKVDRKWYYLGADGAMWTNAVTPDGYQVNGKGEWVQNGVVVVDNGTPAVSVNPQPVQPKPVQPQPEQPKPAEQKTYLETPTGFYMSGWYELHWTKVPHASRYLIQTRTSAFGTERNWAETNMYDMTGYSYQHAWVSITACGPEASRKIVSSSPYVIEDLDVFHDNYNVKGNLAIRDGKPYYENETGEKGGWQQILGSWYHFKKNGYADGPGWFQDADQNWYYFAGDCKMVTGWITDNGVQYFMNDGSNPSFPVGAWVH